MTTPTSPEGGKPLHQWPKDMQPTGKAYAGFVDGVCVAVGMQFSGKRGERENRSTLRDFAGYDIQTLPHADAVAALQAGLEPLPAPPRAAP